MEVEVEVGMNLFLSGTVDGISLGLLYGLFAAAIVALYKATGLLNFAQGSIATVSAIFAYESSVRLHLPFGVSLLLGLLAGPLLGVAIYEFLIVPNGRASSVNLTTRTLGAYLAIEAALNVVWGQGQPFPFPSLLSNSVRIGSGSLQLSSVDIVTLIAAGLLGPGLGFAYRYTRYGLLFRGLADDREAAQMIGVPVRSLERIAWAIAGLVAGVVGLVTAPVSLVSTGMMDLFLLYAFAAAIIGGGLMSIGGAFIGGIIIGCIQDLVTLYANGDVAILIVFATLVLILLVRPSGLLGTAIGRRV